MRLDVTGVGLDGERIVAGGFGIVTLGLEQNAGVVVGAGEAGTVGDGLSVGGEGQGEFLGEGADDAEVEPGLGRGGV